MGETTQESPAKRPREEASSGRGWLSRNRILSVALSVGAIVLGLAAGAVLASLFVGGAEEPGEEGSALELGTGMPEEGSAEAGFVRDMTIHHAQAVEMAEIVRDKTDSEEIKMLAADIALTQQAQIGQMHGWLDVWGLPATGEEPAMSWMGMPTEGRMPGMASPAEIDELHNASSEEADKLFLQLMIPHHEAAVPMANAVIEETDQEEVRRLASAIAASQQAEIEMMQGMLNMRGVTVESSSSPHGGGPHGGD